MKYLVLLFFLFSVMACNKKQQKATLETSIKNDSTVLKSVDISKINYVDYGVDSKAKNTLDSWQAYNTVAVAVENIKEANFDFFKEDNTIFLSTIKDLESTVPENIDSEPIKARLLILKTKLFKLEEILNLSTTKKNEKLIVIKELFQAFSNVTLQINKKFEKEAQNIIKPEEL